MAVEFPSLGEKSPDLVFGGARKTTPWRLSSEILGALNETLRRSNGLLCLGQFTRAGFGRVSLTGNRLADIGAFSVSIARPLSGSSNDNHRPTRIATRGEAGSLSADSVRGRIR